MHTYSKVILPILLLHAIANWLCAAQTPMGTAFNYQGYLTYNGKPADGPHDIQFQIFDVANNGNPQAIVTYAPAYVNKGLFTTNIDFGPVFNGNAYWLQIGIRPNGSQNSYDVQSPRMQIRPVPYALFASNANTAITAATANTASTATTATTATTANGVSANAVGTSGLQDNSVIAGKIASGQVVKSLNGLSDSVTLAAGANVTITTNPGNALTIAAGGGGGSGWSLSGNANTTAGANFLGTTDNEPLELKIDNIRTLRLEPATDSFGLYSPNLIGGHPVNTVLNAIGATIGGGGYNNTFIQNGERPNSISADFGTVGGGAGNDVQGSYGTIGGGYLNAVWSTYGTIPGGFGNLVQGVGSFAAGKYASALHNGCFVWNDSTGTAPVNNGQFITYDNPTTGPNQFRVKASGGVFLSHGSAAPAATLRVQDDGTGVGVFAGDLSPFGTAAFESNLSFPRTHLYFAENGNRVFSIAAGGIGYFEGTVSVCSLTIRGGCDLAEPFQMSEEEIPKGSVVVIDDEHPGRLKRSTQAYDTRVAGIVSGANGVKTGIALKQEGTLDQGENVALSGRVYVKADATFGAIRPGDLLTTSATPGHAMRVTDHARAQGAILGKAMSALSEGKGMVLVLVTLQ
jgi:hypothetical protein